MPIRQTGESRGSLAGTVIAAIALVVSIAALVVRQVATSWQPTIVLSAFAPYPMALSVIAAILFAAVRRWGFAAVSAVTALLVIITQAPLFIAATAPRTGTRLTVLQANLRIGGADPKHLIEQVTAHNVDILVTEELTPNSRDTLVADGLVRALPYHFDAPGAGGSGMALWSRYPLGDEVEYPGYDLRVMSARVRLPSGERPTLFGVHLLPPYPYAAGSWVREIASLRSLLAKDRSAQTIAVGDFNSTTDMPQFRRLLSHGYADASTQAGAGYLTSYPTTHWFSPPLIAIDHVLTRGAVATSAVKVALPGSDHRGLLVHLTLRR